MILVGQFDGALDGFEVEGGLHQRLGIGGLGGVEDAPGDVVILATPPAFRWVHYTYAIEKGVNVFMEKPCCVDAAGYRMLVEANKLADENRIKVGVGLQRRHNSGYVNGIQKIHDGKYGDLICLQAYWNGGGVWVNPRQEGQTEMEYQMRNWYYFNWLCGDHIVEQHVHNLDVIAWFTGKHPTKAVGFGSRQRRVTGDQYDNFSIDFSLFYCIFQTFYRGGIFDCSYFLATKVSNSTYIG